MSKSTFYRHRTKRSEHPEADSESSASESSSEDTNLDKCECTRQYFSASDDDLQENPSAAVPQPSGDDSSCTEPSDDTDRLSESQELVRVQCRS